MQTQVIMYLINNTIKWCNRDVRAEGNAFPHITCLPSSAQLPFSPPLQASPAVLLGPHAGACSGHPRADQNHLSYRDAGPEVPPIPPWGLTKSK